ncbi:MAG: cobalamin biosynthesis protein CbiD [Chitinispirillaceae bacterium]|nr:cobalamin biosynthesis protein CbiD [Chitinispirillaceae bacterium]
MNTDLRSGFTTGACAAAAAKAATMLLCGAQSNSIHITLPDSSKEVFIPEYVRPFGDGCEAGVRKDAGDDPDITDGVLVYARVVFTGSSEISFAAGEGIGMVTLPGLQIAPGEPAINPGPRILISRAIRDVTSAGVRVEIAIPGGEQLARNTFNPRLGVVGGLSILGTTGRVRPYSNKALRDALLCSLDVARACGYNDIIMVPGNIGRRAAEKIFSSENQQIIEVSNEWEAMLDALNRYTFDSVLVMGHPGKLYKLAMGYWNTHSKESPAAVTAIIDRACKQGISIDTRTITAEGVFAGLTEIDRCRLGNILAQDILDAIRKRFTIKTQFSVMLNTIDGAITGKAGDLTRWR